MTFLRPLALLGLVGIPILIALYARHQADRRAAAAVFAAPHMADSVTPNRPGFRRHLPLVAVLVALTALVFAAARPAHSVAESVRHASIMLATDVSSSMAAKDVAPNRLKAAARAAGSFAAKVPASLSVGVIAFNQSPVLLQSPTTDRSQIRPQLDSLRPRGGTATGKAIALATRVINGAPKINGKRPPGAIVLLSDGKSTFGLNPITAAHGREEASHPDLHGRARHCVGNDRRPQHQRPGHAHRDGAAEPRDPGPDRARIGRPGVHRRVRHPPERDLQDARATNLVTTRSSTS